jgi:hypothetical protein
MSKRKSTTTQSCDETTQSCDLLSFCHGESKTSLKRSKTTQPSSFEAPNSGASDSSSRTLIYSTAKSELLCECSDPAEQVEGANDFRPCFDEWPESKFVTPSCQGEAYDSSDSAGFSRDNSINRTRAPNQQNPTSPSTSFRSPGPHVNNLITEFNQAYEKTSPHFSSWGSLAGLASAIGIMVLLVRVSCRV